MAAAREDLPEDVAALKAALIAERTKRIDEAARAARVEAELAVAKAKASDDEALIAHQRLQIEKLTRQPFPEHLPRARVVEPGPATCHCCGSTRLRKLGEDITETLEVIPRQWKVIQHVREKFTCRDGEKISQAPAP